LTETTSRGRRFGLRHRAQEVLEGIVPTLRNLQRLSDCSVKWRSFRESFIDITREFGDVIAAFVAKIAELEGKRIPQRTMTGLENARAKGKVLGRSRKVVDRAKVRRLKGNWMSVRAIAAEVGVSKNTAQRTVQT
jgi:DNA invertase Pin-like site-specific DNA recombinase